MREWRQRLRRQYRRLVKGQFIDDRAGASRACDLARQAIAQARAEAAEAFCIRAIRARPGLQQAYELLGQALDLQGRTEDALCCHRGDLPTSVIHEHFPLRGQRTTTAEYQATGTMSDHPGRIVVHPPKHYPLPPPESITPLPVHGFGATQIRALPTHVDVLQGGSFWHDMHHTVVFDGEGCPVAGHHRGNLSLIESLRSGRRPLHLGKRAFLIGARGAGNYFHWMIDILPKLELAALAGVSVGRDDVIVLPFHKSRFQLETLRHLGITDDQVRFTESGSPYCCADTVVVPGLRNEMATRSGDWIPGFLQRRFLGDAPQGGSGGRRLYVSRASPAAAGRAIENEEAVVQALTAEGFDVVFPERLSVPEQARLFADAGIVVAAHGAGLTNIVFCSAGTRIIELYGAHLAPCYWALSALNRLRYFNLGCDALRQMHQTEGDRLRTLNARRCSGFIVDVPRLLATVRTSQSKSVA